MKRALLFSGGGSLCSRQVGLLHSIVKDNPNIDFHTIAGVSGGAINAGFLHLCDNTLSFDKRLILLDSMWRNIKSNKEIYRERAYGVKFIRAIYAFMFGSLYNPKPLKKLLNNVLDLNNFEEALADVYFGVVDFETGMYQELKPTRDNYVNLMLASSAIPGVFPPVRIGESVFMDGGVRDNIPWKCIFRDQFDEIYILLSRSKVSIQQPIRRNPSRNIFRVAARAIEVGLGEIHSGDIKRIQRLEERGSKVFIYIPRSQDDVYDLTLNEDALNFNNALISERIDDNKNVKPITSEECMKLFAYEF